MAERPRLGVLATHPIQYHAPLFRALAEHGELELTVYFEHRPSAEEQGAGFGVPFEWDVDLTSGYRHVWMRPEDAAGGAPQGDPVSAIRRGDFDAFLVMGWHSRSYRDAVVACWRSGVPVLVRGDSQLGNDASFAKRLVKRAVYPLFLRRFAACLSVGTRSEEYFEYYGARRVVRAPHFVDNERFAGGAARLAPERDTIRARWGIRPDAIVFLFAGKLMPGKRAQDLVAAVREARNERVTALVVGDGVTRAECEELAAPVADRVRFAGFLNQSQMPAAYAAADVLVLPSESETWGLVVNEAMASGRPAIVSSAVGCAPDLVTEGETGYTYPPGDVTRLARLLDEVASDAGLLSRMSRAARSRVAAFSVDAARAGVEAAVRAAVAVSR